MRVESVLHAGFMSCMSVDEAELHVDVARSRNAERGKPSGTSGEVGYPGWVWRSPGKGTHTDAEACAGACAWVMAVRIRCTSDW
jgi:hypothetical protein